MKFFSFIFTMLLASATMVNAKSCEAQKVLAMNIYHEARGEGFEGKVMMADVVFNRIKSNKFPKTVCGVIYQKGQFDWVSNNLPIKDKKLFNEIYLLSGEIIEGKVELPNSGALFFKTKGYKSAFHAKRVKIGVIGKHEFFK